MIDTILFTIAVPLMAFVGLFLLASAILVIYRDVLGFEDKVSERFGRYVGLASGLWQAERFSFLKRFVYAGIAMIFAIIGYWIIRHGVVEPIGLFVFGYDIS